MAPDDLGPFEPLDGRDGRRAPATQHDAWLWISGAEPDVTWQSAHAAVLAVADAAHLASYAVHATSTDDPTWNYRGVQYARLRWGLVTLDDILTGPPVP